MRDYAGSDVELKCGLCDMWNFCLSFDCKYVLDFNIVYQNIQYADVQFVLLFIEIQGDAPLVPTDRGPIENSLLDWLRILINNAML